MHSITSIIIDDEPANCENLQLLLQKYCPQLEVLALVVSINDALEKIIQLKPQLLFLDIELVEGTGFDLLEQLPNKNFEIIFVTAFDKYALKAIKFCALDYLLKPINITELIKAITKVEERVNDERDNIRMQELIRNIGTPSKRIALPMVDKTEFIEVEAISRCQGDGNYTHVYLKNSEKHLVCKSMKEFDELLSDYNFIRTHQSHLINLNEIKAFVKTDGGYIKMKDGSSVSISRQRREMVMKVLKNMH
ncbi:LytR/AlgR family response regulator transcription factor [Carboxylicivirga marina]|uniref:Response regulator transcription factor n=1 Tax=Carboxylicivirga marina TaxID=2800988 RepID=A0ABS1HIT2_9BACT|nr:LytTR family DNA-binding domain-containing protein [Carboxylicivirga marina]MBK3517577.1 response regulator transcription factor [Carboxylicivirga marina]